MLRDYLSKINPNNPNLDAPWCSIMRANSSLAQVWRCVLIHHLTGAENGGNHHCYVDVLDEHGKPYAPLNVAGALSWTWRDRASNEAHPDIAFDKHPPEPLANVPIGWGMYLAVWIGGNIISDVVSGMHTAIDEKPNDAGAFRAHQSYYVVFQLTQQATSAPPVVTPPTLEQRVMMLEAAAKAHGWQL